ncbi:DUF5372 family protein [Microvirga sesbaniae]|uniref:DUF5372 family protein n=1 Tax=Microvirga sesbaniae TaxID=681392 RepID=UPI00358DC5FC
MGSAEVIHPFHPLRGQRCVFLKARCVSGVETLSLRDPHRGSFAIPRDWTECTRPEAQASATSLPLLIKAFACNQSGVTDGPSFDSLGQTGESVRWTSNTFHQRPCANAATSSRTACRPSSRCCEAR